MESGEVGSSRSRYLAIGPGSVIEWGWGRSTGDCYRCDCCGRHAREGVMRKDASWLCREVGGNRAFVGKRLDGVCQLQCKSSRAEWPATELFDVVRGQDEVLSSSLRCECLMNVEKDFYSWPPRLSGTRSHYSCRLFAMWRCTCLLFRHLRHGLGFHSHPNIRTHCILHNHLDELGIQRLKLQQ